MLNILKCSFCYAIATVCAASVVLFVVVTAAVITAVDLLLECYCTEWYIAVKAI